VLGRCSGGGCVLKESADGELGKHFLLHSAEDVGEVDLAGVGSARHDGSRVAEQIVGGARPKREVIDRRQDRLSHCKRNNRYRASGSGRSWKWTTLLLVPLPVSLWNGVRVAQVDHRPLPFQPVFGSSMRPSSPFAKKPIG